MVNSRGIIAAFVLVSSTADGLGTSVVYSGR